MKPNKYEGKLIVLEGLDGSGKTTAAKKIIREIPGLVYFKGLGKNDFWGTMAKRYATTFLFLWEILVTIHISIRPALKRGENILMDKYFFVVASHIPDVEKPINKFFIRLLEKFMIRPDLIIYFIVSAEERLQRLRKGPFNKFHEKLINDPDWMTEREQAYFDMTMKSGLDVRVLDTTTISAEETAGKLKKIITDYLMQQGGEG